MSVVPISRSPDLRHLRDEGYEAEVSNGYLLISHVPYVTSKSEVSYGILVSPLSLSGDVTIPPRDHVALWIGEHPCDDKGSRLVKVIADENRRDTIREGLVTTCSFSQKPQPEGNYPDYYQKMTSYVNILGGYARAIDPKATAQTHPGGELSEEESVFCYMDNASSRAGIVAVSEKLRGDRIAIVGLGGTGAYILDFVAKTPVAEVHLFDKDTFLQHNAFRCPGAPSFNELKTQPAKVVRLAEIYSKMHRKIIAHQEYVDDKNLEKLKSMTFVFLCLDKAASRTSIVDFLIRNKIPFIDVGMGLYLQDESNMIGGLIRTTSCGPSTEEIAKARIPFAEDQDDDDVYSRNIQVAELNALNAVLAVIRWKKVRGVYVDFENEYHSVYGIDTNTLTNVEVVPDETKVNQA